MSASVSHPQAPSIPKGPGPPPTPDPSILNATDAEKYVRIKIPKTSQ